MPTRFNAVSTAGQPGQNKNSKNRADWVVETITFPVQIVASTADQSTGVFLPPNAAIRRLYARNFTVETTGMTKTVTVKRESQTIDDVSAQMAGITGPALGVPSSGIYPATADAKEELKYALGSNDFAELDQEVMVEISYPVN